MRRRFSRLGLCLLLASCTLIPEMKKPALPVSSQWEAVPPTLSTEGERAAADIGWREFFISQPLQTVVTEALEHNRDLRIAALNVAATRALYRIERADLIPGVTAGVDGFEQRLTEAQDSSGGSAITVSEYTANLASTGFELDLFGRLRSRNRAALETFFATEAARDAVKISLIGEVANAYLQWLANRKALELTEATLAAQEKTHELIDIRHEHGVASKLELAQVRSVMEAARADLALFERRVMQDRNALVLLMGVKQTGFDFGLGTLDDTRVMEGLPVELSSEVLLLRPDIRQAEHELRAANADIGAARAAFFPRISLTGTVGFASSELADLFSGAAAGAWSFIPQITVPLFQGGRLKANLEFSETQKEIAVARYEKAIQTAFREVADELAARATLDRELEAQQRQVAANREAYDLSFTRYKAGIDNFLAVLDAQRALFAAQQRQIDIEKQRLANMVNLYKALGGGLLETSP